MHVNGGGKFYCEKGFIKCSLEFKLPDIARDLSVWWHSCAWALSLLSSICGRIQVAETLFRDGGGVLLLYMKLVFTPCSFRSSRKLEYLNSGSHAVVHLSTWTTRVLQLCLLLSPATPQNSFQIGFNNSGIDLPFNSATFRNPHTKIILAVISVYDHTRIDHGMDGIAEAFKWLAMAGWGGSISDKGEILSLSLYPDRLRCSRGDHSPARPLDNPWAQRQILRLSCYFLRPIAQIRFHFRRNFYWILCRSAAIR